MLMLANQSVGADVLGSPSSSMRNTTRRDDRWSSVDTLDHKNCTENGTAITLIGFIYPQNGTDLRFGKIESDQPTRFTKADGAVERVGRGIARVRIEHDAVAAFLAILLHYPTWGRTVFRTAFFAPMIMPTVAIAILWQYIYEPGNGLLTALIQLVKPDFEFAWLATPGWSLLWIFVTICWQYTGFHTVLFMAGLSGIPNDYFEAARIDGASEWQICWHIILPLLKPTAIVSATLSIVGSLKYFDLVYMMSGGLPAESREVMATYIYRLAFDQGQGRFGYGSAAAVMLFLTALLVVIPLQSRRLRSGLKEETAP